MNRLQFKQSLGQEWREEHGTLRPRTLAERDAVILMTLRMFEHRASTQSGDLGCYLLHFLRLHEASIPTQAATLHKKHCFGNRIESEGPLQSACRTLAGELGKLNPKKPRDAIEKRLDWICEEAELDELDRLILGVLVRAHVSASYAYLLSFLSPCFHQPHDVHILSLIFATGCSRKELKARLRNPAPLIAKGLVRDVKDDEFEATSFAIGLAQLRSPGSAAVKQAFRAGVEQALAAPAREYLSWGFKDIGNGNLVLVEKARVS